MTNYKVSKKTQLKWAHNYIKKANGFQRFQRDFWNTFGERYPDYKRKSDPTNRIQPGVYYAERGLAGEGLFKKLFQNTAYNQQIRHGYFAVITDDEPDNMPAMQLPNGQYVTTFAGDLVKKFGNFGNIALSVNRKSNGSGAYAMSDYNAIRALVDPDFRQNSDYQTWLQPIELEPNKSADLAQRLYDVTSKYEGKSLGTYHTGALPAYPANNCINAAGLLARLTKMDRDKLPDHFGMMGGYDKKDLDASTEHMLNKIKEWDSV